MFALYENPRAATLLGKMIVVLGIVIEETETYGTKVRYVVCDDKPKNANPIVLSDYFSKDVDLYVGPGSIS